MSELLSQLNLTRKETLVLCFILLCTVAILCMITAVFMIMKRLKTMESERKTNDERMNQRIQETEAKSNIQAEKMQESIGTVIENMDDSIKNMLGRIEVVQQAQSDELSGQLKAVRKSLDDRIDQISEQNRDQISELKASMEEQLGDAVDRRITDSFSQVSGRLDQVSASLGALQNLAVSVDEFNKMLDGTTPLGLYGEAQLGNLLAQMLAPQQYAQHAQVHPEREDTVDYAVVMPGQAEGRTVYLPIDASLPTREYQEFLSAIERGSRAEIESAREILESAVRMHARRISEKMIAPPYTTDYGLLFLQSESLYAELLRINGLADRIQRESHIVLVGPATLAALLSGLQVGFRSLAIEQQTGEIVELLGAVRTEFAKYANTLDRTQKRLRQASEEIERAQRQGQLISSRLSDVQKLPGEQSKQLLHAETDEDEDSAWD
ncbi:MAG: DNA recombination protein RmuC [Clostridia bacterium]|nr:DNA recombination protein RmuC [Clostridia bacterium]